MTWYLAIYAYYIKDNSMATIISGCYHRHVSVTMRWQSWNNTVQPCRAGSRPVQQMPMHRSDFDGDAYVTVCISQILKFLILLCLFQSKMYISHVWLSILQIISILLSFTFSQLQISMKMHLSDSGSGSSPAMHKLIIHVHICIMSQCHKVWPWPFLWQIKLTKFPSLGLPHTKCKLDFLCARGASLSLLHADQPIIGNGVSSPTCFTNHVSSFVIHPEGCWDQQ